MATEKNNSRNLILAIAIIAILLAVVALVQLQKVQTDLTNVQTNYNYLRNSVVNNNQMIHGVKDCVDINQNYDSNLRGCINSRITYEIS